MIPILYSESETAFLTRGYGALAECLSCSVTEELNGAYTLELKYPKNGILAEYLQPRNIIVAKPNWSTDREAFRIYKVNKTLKNAITVYANQLSYDLSGFVVLPHTSTSLSAAITYLNTSAGGFTLSTSKTSATDFVVDVPSSVRSWFGGKEGSLIDLYGGEWSFNFWSCVLNASRGADNGLRISYGVNLAEYQKELDDNKYSKVLAYFSKDIDNVKTVVYGSAVSTGASGTDRTLILDATSNWNDSVPTAADLTTYATNYISAHASALKNHKQTITITPEILTTQAISMGDTVHVIYDDEIVSTRVVKTVWDALGGKYTTVELGTKKTSIAETIKSLNEDISTPSYQNLVRDVQANNSSVVDSNRVAKLGLASLLSYSKTSNIVQLTDNGADVFPEIPVVRQYMGSAGSGSLSLPDGCWLIYTMRYGGSDSGYNNYLGLYVCLARFNGSHIKAISSPSGISSMTIARSTSGATLSFTTSVSNMEVGAVLLYKA